MSISSSTAVTSGPHSLISVYVPEVGSTTAVDVLTTRGRLVMVAIHPQPREVNLHRFFWRELELLGARLYQRERQLVLVGARVDAHLELGRETSDHVVLLEGAASSSRLRSSDHR